MGVFGLLSACLTVAVLLPSSSSAAREAVACGPPTAKGKSRTLLESRGARVYLVSRPSRRARHLQLIFACVRGGIPRRLGSSNRPFYNGRPIAVIDTKQVRLSPPWVGYPATASGPDTSTLSVEARSLRSTRVDSCQIGGARAPEPRPSVTNIVLSRRGTLAWIGLGSSDPTSVLGPLVKRVALCTSAGSSVLDEGEGIDLHSLTLSGTSLQWIGSGAKRSAVLH